MAELLVCYQVEQKARKITVFQPNPERALK